MKKTEEIEAILIRETHRWGTTALVTCVKNEDAEKYEKAERNLTDVDQYERIVKLESEEGELEPGVTYRFYGSWSKHWRYGWQFHAQTFTKCTPHDKVGVINYLLRAPGIGKKRAEKLWSVFGENAVRTLRETPEKCAEALVASRTGDASEKVTPAMLEKMREAAAYLEEQKGVEDATIDLVSLLAGRGLPKRITKELIKHYGNRAAERIRRNPYTLMKFKGVGFLRADQLYLDLGGNVAKLKRQTLAIWHGIASASDGDTWFGTQFVEATLSEKIAGAEARPVDAIRLGLRAGLLVMHRDESGQPWFTTRKMSEDEAFIAGKIAYLSAREGAWPETSDDGLSDHQREQLKIATSRPVGIFAGDPGTGKSFTAALLVMRIAELSGFGSIAVVAPTGKAAVRVTEAMNACGVSLRAKTIHSLLKVANADDGWSFEHCESNPLEERYVIVDEASMLDTPIMAALSKALRQDGHLLLIGDLQQLPPVGHGAPLRDLLSAGVPMGNLTEIRRNSGAIVKTCAMIRGRESLSLADCLDPDTGLNLCIKRCNVDDAAGVIERLVCTVRDRQLCDATWELQVIVALNEKSSLSRAVLNKALQVELNCKNRDEKARFWANDKIVCLRNQMLPAELDMMETVDEDLEGLIGESQSGEATCYVANGEIGRVIAVYPNKMVMEFFSPRRVVLLPKAEGADIEAFDLGYAISCHKSQGSQWRIVIVALDPSGGARRVCDRSWAYTAISRASEICFLVGIDQTLSDYCRSQKIDNRKTFLAERFKAAIQWGTAQHANSHDGDEQPTEDVSLPSEANENDEEVPF